MARIGIYVRSLDFRVRKSTKQTHYNTYQWIGIEIIRDVLIRNGYEPEYCSPATVKDFDIILVSITGVNDWYGFIRERSMWPEGKYTVVVGGPGVTNVRPVLEHADIFVFGRGEDIIVPLIRHIMKSEHMTMVPKDIHPSICYANTFSIEKEYSYQQPVAPYPHEITLPSGKSTFIESGTGCQRKCLFCHYSWSRKKTGSKHSKILGGEHRFSLEAEFTAFDINFDDPDSVTKSRINVGLDGTSERLRMMVNKPIKRELLEKLMIFASKRNNKIKMYNIIGYPSETEDDWKELMETIVEADSKCDSDVMGSVLLQNNPFIPFPCTPTATWPSQYKSFSGYDLKLLRTFSPAYSIDTYNIYRGKHFQVHLFSNTKSLATMSMDMLIHRGTEEHAEFIKTIALSSKFRSASTKVKQKTMEKHIDIEKLFGRYSFEDLPTRNINGQIAMKKAIEIGDRNLKKYGGIK